jgi:hypothetical protein
MGKEGKVFVSFLFARSHFMNLPYTLTCTCSVKYFNPDYSFLAFNSCSAMTFVEVDAWGKKILGSHIFLLQFLTGEREK